MTRKRVFRMSGPAVVIGFILLVPSIIGICFGGLTMLITVVGSASAPSSIDPQIQRVRTRLVSLKVPGDIVADVVAGKQVEENRLTSLAYSQTSAVRQSEIEISAAKAAPGLAACCGGGFSVVIMIGSFVGGLVGWLLVMRKTVLQCFRCGAVVAAS